MSEGVLPDCITTIHLPKKACRSLALKRSIEKGLPLSTPAIVASPVKEKMILLSAQGHKLPSLSTTYTVTNDRLRPFALIN